MAGKGGMVASTIGFLRFLHDIYNEGSELTVCFNVLTILWQRYRKHLLAVGREFGYNYYLHTKGATNNG